MMHNNCFFSKNWLINKIINKNLTIVFEKYAKGVLLDIGCGDKPYKEQLLKFVDKYLGVDHQDTMHDKSNIDIVGTAYNIPVKDEFADTILCTSVLEHLEEPDNAIKETSRVLKNNGYAIYTAPLFWHLHEEPRDFYRYTKYGLDYLFKKNRLEIIELKPLSGFFVTFGQELSYYLWFLRKGGIINPLFWIIPIITSIIQIICYLLNFFDRSYSFTWIYLIIAKKN